MSTTTANADADESAPPRAVDIRRDVPALLLVALTALTLVSVLTHDPADPVPTPFWPLNQFFTPDLAVYPANDVVQNACGSLGALISSMLLSAVGIGSALVISAGGGIATALLIRGHMNAPVLRSLGGCITLLAVTTAAAMTDIELNGMPVVGNGGYLGAMTSTFLLQHFHPVGSWILTLTVLSVGLLLTTDYMLVYAGRTVLFGGAKVSRRGFAKAAKAMPVTLRRRRQPFSDLDGPILIDGDESDASLDPNGGRIDPPEPAESGPTIKLRKPKEREAAAEDETEDAEEAAPANGLAKVAKLGAAGLAAAAGIGTSLKKSKEAPEELEEEYEYEEWEEEEEEAPTRDLEVEGEPTTLRNDSAHDESPSPTIKMPKKKDAK
ncbi:DNA translocase FtsK 4TM domain-containing protein, partial [Rhodopirellula bahusiensis]